MSFAFSSLSKVPLNNPWGYMSIGCQLKVILIVQEVLEDCFVASAVLNQGSTKTNMVLYGASLFFQHPSAFQSVQAHLFGQKLRVGHVVGKFHLVALYRGWISQAQIPAFVLKKIGEAIPGQFIIMSSNSLTSEVRP